MFAFCAPAAVAAAALAVTAPFFARGVLQVDKKYELIKPIGHGAYGVVVSARNTNTGEKVAIKKVRRAHWSPVDARLRALGPRCC